MSDRFGDLLEFSKHIPPNIKAEGCWVSFKRHDYGWDVFLYDTEYSPDKPRYIFVLTGKHLGDLAVMLLGSHLHCRVLTEYEIDDYLNDGKLPDRWVK